MRVIDHGATTDVGRKRSHNEDALWFLEGAGTYLVADGMGGMARGDLASRIAVGAFARAFGSGGRGATEAILAATAAAQAEIAAAYRPAPGDRGMGTTLAVLQVQGGSGVVAHMGDSRVYRIRGGLIESLTRDHTWVREQVEKGALSPEEGARHPYRNVLTRSLGTASEDHTLEVRELRVEAGDVFVLCTDGLYGLVADEEIGAVAAGLPAEEACRVLTQMANERGGSDNITVQVVRIGGGSPRSARKVALMAAVAALLLVVVGGAAWGLLGGPSRPARGGGSVGGGAPAVGAPVMAQPSEAPASGRTPGPTETDSQAPPDGAAPPRQPDAPGTQPSPAYPGHGPIGPDRVLPGMTLPPGAAPRTGAPKDGAKIPWELGPDTPEKTEKPQEGGPQMPGQGVPPGKRHDKKEGNQSQDSSPKPSPSPAPPTGQTSRPPGTPESEHPEGPPPGTTERRPEASPSPAPSKQYAPPGYEDRIPR